MRKTLSFLTLLFLCLTSISAQNYGLKYQKSGSNASVIGWEASAVTDGVLTIPGTLDGYNVSEINFSDANTDVKSITKLVFSGDSYDDIVAGKIDIHVLENLTEVEITTSNAYVQLREAVNAALEVFKVSTPTVTCPNLNLVDNVYYAQYDYKDSYTGQVNIRYAAVDVSDDAADDIYIKIHSELYGSPVNKVYLPKLPDFVKIVAFEGNLSYIDPNDFVVYTPDFFVCNLYSYANLSSLINDASRDPFIYTGEVVEKSPIFINFSESSLVLCGALGDQTDNVLNVSPSYTENYTTYNVIGFNMDDYSAYFANSTVTNVEFEQGFGNVQMFSEGDYTYDKTFFPNAQIVCNDWMTYNLFCTPILASDKSTPFNKSNLTLSTWGEGDFLFAVYEPGKSNTIENYTGSGEVVTIPFATEDGTPVVAINSIEGAKNAKAFDFSGAQTTQMRIADGIDFTNFITIGLNKKVGEKKIIYTQNAGQQYDAIANGVLFYMGTNPNLSTYNDAIASGYVGSESEIYVPKSVTIEEESVRVAGFEYKNMYYEGVTKVTFENYDTYRSALFDYAGQGVEFAFDTDKAIQTEELILIEDQYGSLTIIDYKDGLDVVTIKKEFTALDGKKYSLPDALQIPFLEKLKNVKVEGEFSSVSVDIIDDDNNEVIRSLDLTGITGHAKIGYNETSIFKQVIVRPDEQTQYTNETNSYYDYHIFFSNAKDYTGDLIPNPSDNIRTDDGLLLVVNYYDESEDELHLKLLGYAGDETKLSLPAYITINGRKAYIDDIASGLEEKFANTSVTSLTVALNAGESNNTFNATGLTYTFPNIQEVHCSDAIVYEAFISCDYISDELKKNVSISLVAEDYNGFAIAYAGTGENEYAIMNYNGNEAILTVPFDYNGNPITLLMTLAPSDGSAEAGNFLVVDFSGNQKERMMVSGHDFENYTVVLPKDKMENKMVDIYYGPAETLSENPYLTSDGMVFRKEEDGNLTLIGFMPEVKSVTVSDLNTIDICVLSPDIEELTLSNKDDIMFGNFSTEMMPKLKKITIFRADMKGYFDDVLYDSDVEVVVMQLKADNMTFTYGNDGLTLVDVETEDFTCELKEEYTFDNVGTLAIAPWMEIPASTMAKITYLGLPSTIMEMMVFEDEEGTTLPSNYLTISIANDEEIMSVEPLQNMAKAFIVPSAMLESYQSEYSDFAHKFLSADGLNSDNDNVEYDDETNTLTVTVTEPEAAFDILSDVAAAVNAGAKNAENIVINLTTDIDLAQDDDMTTVWTSIGTAEAPFTGTFAGNGHTVTGLTASTGALFGVVGSEGRVDSLFVDATLTIDTNKAVEGEGTTETGETVASGKWIGLLADVNNGDMHDIFAVVDVDADFDQMTPDTYFAIVGENNGSLSHISVVIYAGSKEDDNRATGSSMGETIKVGQGTGSGGSITKCCLAKTRKLMQKGATINYDVAECNPIEVCQGLRLYDEQAWVSGEAAYWFNFDGEGYTGNFDGKYTFRDNKVCLASPMSGATVRLTYDANNDDAIVSGRRFANLGSTVTISYSVAPREITGATVKLQSENEATLTLPKTLPENGSIAISLVYDEVVAPTGIEAPEAEKEAFVAIYDMAGRMVSAGNVSGLPVGLYVAVQADGSRMRIAVK